MPQMLFDLSALRENVALDEAQRVTVKAKITSTQDFVGKIDIKILALENELSNLRTQRDAALESILIPQALLAPVRKLAPELLAQIFEYCVPEKPTHITTFDSREAPLLLTRICHRWRLVAQYFPRLWTHIVLYERSPESRFSSLWFNNSGTSPLDVTIDHSDHNGWDIQTSQRDILVSSEHSGNGWREDRYLRWTWSRSTPEQSEEMVRAVVQQFSRIRNLKMICYTSTLEDYFLLEQVKNVASLHEFSVELLDTRGWSAEGGDITSLIQGISLPQLQTLILHSAAENLLPVIRHTSNLRELHIDRHCALTTLMNFIYLCPTLERLNAFGMHGERSTLAPYDKREQLEFPNLLHLGLGFMSHWARSSLTFIGSGDSDGLKTRTEWLRTPNLRSMKLQNWPDGKNVLSACLADSRPVLRELSLERMKLQGDSFDGLMAIFAEIETLVIVDSETYQGFWEALVPEEGTLPAAWGFPKLKTLTLKSIDVEHEDVLVQFVERRAQPVRMHGEQPLGEAHYLEEISIATCLMNVETIDALVQLRESRDGLIVKIDDTPTHNQG